MSIADRVLTTDSAASIVHCSADHLERSASEPSSVTVSWLMVLILACVDQSQPRTVLAMVKPSQPPRAGLVLAVLSVAAFMASLDVFIVNVAFDSIGADFSGTSLSELSWVLNAYAVVFAALLVPAGRLADRY